MSCQIVTCHAEEDNKNRNGAPAPYHHPVFICLDDPVIWNDELDFDATSIYDDGEVVGCVETTLNQQIGFLLAKTRDEMNVTQTELSKKSHIDQGDISKIERGIGNPTIAKISKLFRALGRSISLTLL